MLKFQRPKGTYDITPSDAYIYKYIQQKVDDFALCYGFNYIETPIIEKTELFSQSVGEATDIVEKEMYSFETRGGDKLTLRPEGTAPVIRAYIENGLKVMPHPLKLYYYGPFFRHEKPQRLRFREFRQFGLEVIGSESSISDAEVIFLMYNFINDLGIKEVELKLNSVGCVNCRQNYLSNLLEYVKPFFNKLPKEAKDRVKKNILKVFDLKEIKVQNILKNAPQIIDFLCEECKKNLEEMFDYLDFFKIPYNLAPYLVRGLDYYTKTVFEFYAKGPDESIAIGGGGRYDFLIKSLGGPDHSATGAALGIERLIEIIKTKDLMVRKELPKIFLAHAGELGRKFGLQLLEDLRKKGIAVVQNFGKTTLKSQLKYAKRFKLNFVVICAQKELLEGSLIIRDSINGVQKEMKIADALAYIEKEKSNLPK